MKRSLIGTLLFLALGFTIAFGKTPNPQPSQTAISPRPTASEPVESIEVVTVTPTPEPTPEISWRDNPHGCNEQTQWIAEAPPFACIDKPQPTPQPTTQPVVPQSVPAPVHVSGDKYSWMAGAGIPQSDWQYVDYIVGHESGWNPSAVNPSSGACGLGQQLPCGKWPGAWNDPVAALRAQHGYVVARYGSYAGAYAFWLENHWY